MTTQTVKTNGNLDFEGIGQLLGAVLEARATDRAEEGTFWKDTADGDKWKARLGGATVTIFPQGGTGISPTIGDAKGDLIGFTAADTPARKAVGANGTVLVADSTDAVGFVWRVIADGDLPAGLARDTEVTTAIDNLRTEILGAGVPAALNTLDELAAALADDANFAATVTTALGLRMQQFTDLVGDGVATDITVTHGLNTLSPVVQVLKESDGRFEIVPFRRPNAATIELNFPTGAPPSADEYRVTVLGLPGTV